MLTNYFQLYHIVCVCSHCTIGLPLPAGNLKPEALLSSHRTGLCPEHVVTMATDNLR